MANRCKRFYSILFACLLLFVFCDYLVSFIEVKKKHQWAGAKSFFDNKIFCRSNWIELYGLTQRIWGKRQIENFTIYKSSYGKMAQVENNLSEEAIDKSFKELYPLIKHLEAKRIPYYYITSLLPIQDISDFPTGMIEGSHLNQSKLFELLKKHNVNTINLANLSQIKSISKDRLFYKTDHHWALETCFAAYQGITERIRKDYGFNLNSEVTANLDNYDAKILKNSFLGSYGIKVGKYYAGKDDFIIYIPKFKTDLIFKSYDANRKLKQVKSGDFYQALINDNMVTDPNYNDKYNAYSNFGYIENQVINNNAPNELKCLYISHSYGRPLTMYLSLNFKEIVNLDPQKKRFSGNYLTFIADFKPDVVLIQTEFEGMIIGEYKTEG